MIGRIKKVGAELLFNGIMDNQIHDVIAMLSAEEVDVNAQNHNGQTPLHVAIDQQNIDMIKTLIEYGANPNIQDTEETGLNNAIHMATARNMPHVLDLFLKNEQHVPELEAKNMNGFTALHIAANMGHADIV